MAKSTFPGSIEHFLYLRGSELLSGWFGYKIGDDLLRKKGICIISANCELEPKSLGIFCLWAWGWGGGLGKWAGVGGRFRLIRILSKENVLFLTDSLPNWW